MARVPSRGTDQFVLRFPEGMREGLKEAAEKNGRSMNAEILTRLEEYEGLNLRDGETLAAFVGRLQDDLDNARHANTVLRDQVPDFPPGLMERINRAAVEHRRSRAEEIVQALEAAFPLPPTPQADAFISYWDRFLGEEGSNADAKTGPDAKIIANMRKMVEFVRAESEAGRGEGAIDRFWTLHYRNEAGDLVPRSASKS